MAFRRLAADRRKIQLVSLIDLIFILLIFFIIASILIKLTKGESRLYLPTPVNEPGEAQILIQILDQDNYLWLDHTAIDTLAFYSYRLPSPVDNRAKVDLLLNKMTRDRDQLFAQIENLKEESNFQSTREYFVLIRCPDHVPYHYATSIIERLSENPNFEYGCVAGSIEDIRSSKNIYAEGNIIQIDL